MIKNFLKMLTRTTRRQASYSLLNIIGFALGIATVLIITLYVSIELSYESSHQNANRIVRVTEKIRPSGIGQASASVPIPVGPQLKDDFPHLVENSTRVFRFESPLMFEYRDAKFSEQNIFFTDNSVFSVFTYNLQSGDTQTALDEPNQIVISESLALKYFNSTNVIGNVIRYDDKLDLEVTGVMADGPSNSHFRPAALISFPTLNALLTERQIASWFWNPAYTYVLLQPGENQMADLQASLDGFMKKYFNETKYKNKSLELQAMRDIYLHSSFDNELEQAGSWTYLKIIMVVGAFVLVLAVINFINLSTARAMNRAKEVGVRKVLGSARRQLIMQFLFESCTLTLLATVFALALALLSLPFVNDYLGLNIGLTKEHAWILYVLFPFAAFVGILSGLYPSLYLSSFRPVQVLKGKFWSGSERGVLRKSLVIAQFAVTIILIVGSIVVWNQFSFLQTKELGFKKENVLIIPIQRSAIGNVETFRSFKQRVELEKGVVAVTGVEDVVGNGHNSGSYTPEGTSESVLYPRLFVREDFTKVFDIKLLAGQTFASPYRAPETVRELMINESMVKSLGWSSPEEAIGKKMGEFTIEGKVYALRVIGVVKDFNFVSLHSAVGPLILEAPPTDDVTNLFMIKYLAVSVDDAQRQELIARIENHWNALSGGKLFEYTYLDENLERAYVAEDNLSRMNNLFSALAILVSCLGLIGLASYVLTQRQKEVSIRKVLGSSVSNIAMMLTAYFLKILLVAAVVAVPLSYFLLDSWLNNFAYRIELSAAYFVIAIVATLLLAIGVIAYQTLQTALINPVKMLRSE